MLTRPIQGALEVECENRAEMEEHLSELALCFQYNTPFAYEAVVENLVWLAHHPPIRE